MTQHQDGIPRLLAGHNQQYRFMPPLDLGRSHGPIPVKPACPRKTGHTQRGRAYPDIRFTERARQQYNAALGSNIESEVVGVGMGEAGGAGLAPTRRAWRLSTPTSTG